MANKITNDDLFAPVIESIEEVANAFKALKNSKLTERAILVLLQDSTGLPLATLKNVIWAAANLDKKYLKP